MSEPLMTTEELSAHLQVPIRTLSQWAYLKKGPTYMKVGRHRRYRLSDVEAWLVSVQQ